MSTQSIGSPGDMRRVVERQLTNWEIAKTQRFDNAGRPTDVHHFVCIARQVGAGGREIAQLLGQKTGWSVFDRELLHTMAEDDETRERLYERLDEHDMNWLEQMLDWVIQARFTSDDYFSRLTRVILVLARGGPAIFLGRAADLILPRNQGLRVQIIAPLERRLRRLAQRQNASAENAERELRRLEHDRAEFVKNHFGRDALDTLRFDLVLNTDTWTDAQSVDLMLAALHARGMT